MQEPTEEQKRKWVRAWQSAGRELKAVRVQELRSSGRSLEEDIAAFDGFFEKAIRDLPPRESSGLVEQQRWFQRLREKQQSN
jgi:hypothetical protein